MPSIPICPLMSAGSETPMVCLQEKCGWYLNGTKNCAMYVIAHKSALEIKEKQAERK